MTAFPLLQPPNQTEAKRTYITGLSSGCRFSKDGQDISDADFLGLVSHEAPHKKQDTRGCLPTEAPSKGVWQAEMVAI